MLVNKDNLYELTGELAKLCPVMAKLISGSPPPPLRLREGGFIGLLRIIVFQQISIAAGNAIWSRFEAAVNKPTPFSMSEAKDEVLQAAGLSRPKIKTMKALAVVILTGEITKANLAGENTSKLLEVNGIGPWTVQIYELACLGEADSWPAGDIALQEAMKDIFGLETRPDAKQVSEIAARWQPYRAIAARLLWAHYTAMKDLKKEMLP